MRDCAQLWRGNGEPRTYFGRTVNSGRNGRA
jgi:hypothetical protein